MKVKCTNSEWESEFFWNRLRDKIFGRNKPDPVEGGIYVVTEVEGLYYYFEEFGDEGYRREYFIPIQDNYTEAEEVTFKELVKEHPVYAN